MKIETLEVTDEVSKSVKDYVRANYKSLENSDLSIKKGNSGCFYVFSHPDKAPMVLGKGIV